MEGASATPVLHIGGDRIARLTTCPFALALTILLGLLILFRLALALGAPPGRLAGGGGHRVLRSSCASAAPSRSSSTS